MLQQVKTMKIIYLPDTIQHEYRQYKLELQSKKTKVNTRKHR